MPTHSGRFMETPSVARERKDSPPSYHEATNGNENECSLPIYHQVTSHDAQNHCIPPQARPTGSKSKNKSWRYNKPLRLVRQKLGRCNHGLFIYRSRRRDGMSKSTSPEPSAHDILYRPGNAPATEWQENQPANLTESDEKRIERYAYMLENLERTFPKMFLCFSCLDFHPADSVKLHRATPEPVRSCCASNDVKLTIGAMEEPTLYFWGAHDLMRSYRLGSSYRSSGRLWRPLRPPQFSGGWDNSEWSWRVVGGRLLLRGSSSSSLFLQEAVIGEALPEFIPGCLHSQNGPGLRRMISETVDRSMKSAGGVEAVESKLFRCQWCPSEFRARVQTVYIEPGSQKAYRVELTHLLDLGRCLSSQSREWVALTTPAPAEDLHASTNGHRCAPFSFMGLPSVESRLRGDAKSVEPRAL